MEHTPFFSVIIPSYNRKNLLGQAIDSVKHQSFTNYEIIVVDDGSTDGTDVLLAGMENDITCIRQENKGPGSARNTGVDHANGLYVVFLDSDDIWPEWSLDIYHSTLTENGYPSLLSGSISQIDQMNNLNVSENECANYKVYPDYISSFSDGLYIGAGMLIVLKEAFQKVGGFHENKINAEDHDLVLRLGDEAGYINLLSPKTVLYRQHQGQETKFIQKTVDGVNFLIRSEKKGLYPGGDEKRLPRLQIICSHARSHSINALSSGMIRSAFQVYVATWVWNIRLYSFKYIVGFPMLILWNNIKRNVD